MRFNRFYMMMPMMRSDMMMSMCMMARGNEGRLRMPE